jgi:hypothetical protein
MKPKGKRSHRYRSPSAACPNSIQDGLKEGHTLSLSLFNLASEYAVGGGRKERLEMNVTDQLLVYVNEFRDRKKRNANVVTG